MQGGEGDSKGEGLKISILKKLDLLSRYGTFRAAAVNAA